MENPPQAAAHRKRAMGEKALLQPHSPFDGNPCSQFQKQQSTWECKFLLRQVQKKKKKKGTSSIRGEDELDGVT